MGEEGRIGGGWGGSVCSCVLWLCKCDTELESWQEISMQGGAVAAHCYTVRVGEVLLLLLTYSLFLFTSCKHIAAWALSHKEWRWQYEYMMSAKYLYCILPMKISHYILSNSSLSVQYFLFCWRCLSTYEISQVSNITRQSKIECFAQFC